MILRVQGFTGSLNRQSRARALVDVATAMTAQRMGAYAAGYDLADLQPALGRAARIEDLAPLPRALVAQLISADVLILGAPLPQGRPAGLLRHFLGLLPVAALERKPVLLLALGADDAAARQIAAAPERLLGLAGAQLTVRAMSGVPADFAADFPLTGQPGGPRAPATLARLDRIVAPFARCLAPAPAMHAA